MDVGGELSVLGMLVMSARLPAAMTVVAALSLGRSISASTAIGPTLLLLLGEPGVCLLVLYSAELVGLRGLATAATRCALLLEREGLHLYDTIRLQSLDLAGRGLAEDLSYNLHSRRELAEDYHCLHVGRELEASILEICEVAQHLHDQRSGMGAGRDHCREEAAEFGVGRADAGGAIVLLQVLPDLFYHSEVGDGNLNGPEDMQGNVAEHLLIVFIQSIVLLVRAGGAINKPLALGPEVGLHGGVPLLPVRTSKDQDHLVESAGHSENSCWEPMESASECNIRQARKREYT